MNWLDNGEVLSAIGEFFRRGHRARRYYDAGDGRPDVRGLGRFLGEGRSRRVRARGRRGGFLSSRSRKLRRSRRRYNEGDEVEEGTVFATLKGYADVLLTGERVALNLMQRMSGIATLTRQYVQGHRRHESPDRRYAQRRRRVLRLLEKYAVTVGGGKNHRMGLDDGVLIKDNHIALAGGITEAVMRQSNRSGICTRSRSRLQTGRSFARRSKPAPTSSCSTIKRPKKRQSSSKWRAI